MSFVEAVLSGFDNYANFSGRAVRSAYWWWALFAWLAGVVANFIDSALGWRVFESTVNGIEQGSGPIGVVVGLALLIPNMSVAVRRLHDTNRSGWWLLLVLIPIIGWIVLIIFLASGGTPGPNKYGPPQDGTALAYPR